MERVRAAARSLRGNPFFADELLAACLAAMAQAEIWLAGSVSASRGWVVPAAIVITGAVAFRRRVPLGAAATAAGAWTLQTLLGGDVDSAISVNVAILVLLYSVAAHTPPRRGAAVGAAVMLAAAWIGIARHPDSGYGDYFFSAMVLGGAWLFGAVMRSRRRLALGLEDRATMLEHERDERARLAVAEERARIARELHDVVAHSVSVIVVQAGVERHALEPEADGTREVLLTIERTGRQALAELRRLLGMLRMDDTELALAPQPSVAHLGNLVEQVREAGLPVELDVEGEPRAIPPGVDLSAYRIVQEALTNALKHAGPARARVWIRYTDRDIELEIVDDGDGAPPSDDGAGHGLVGMRERVALYGGALKSGRRETGGWAVRARLPFGS